MYTCFDKIVNVSFAMKKKFDSLHLCPSNRSFVVYNRINIPFIVQKSNEHLNQNNVFTIVTVSRIEDLKGSLELCQVAKKLSDSHLVFQWLFIGTGVMENICRRYVKALGIGDKVKFVGPKSNPFPYIKNADLFVSGSKTETFGLGIVEALVLGTPVVAKRYDAIDEVMDETSGFVVDSYEEMSCILVNLLSGNDLHERFKFVRPILDYNRMNDIHFGKLIEKHHML